MFHGKHSPNLNHTANPVRLKGQPQISGFANDARLQFLAVPCIKIACAFSVWHCQNFAADASPISVVKCPDDFAFTLKLVSKYPANERQH